MTCSPTSSPTRSPTCSPTRSPTPCPTRSPTRSSTPCPTRSLTRVPTSSTTAPRPSARQSGTHMCPRLSSQCTHIALRLLVRLSVAYVSGLHSHCASRHLGTAARTRPHRLLSIRYVVCQSQSWFGLVYVCASLPVSNECVPQALARPLLAPYAMPLPLLAAAPASAPASAPNCFSSVARLAIPALLAGWRDHSAALALKAAPRPLRCSVARDAPRSCTHSMCPFSIYWRRAVCVCGGQWW